MNGTIRLRVSASTSNLGAGFDCIGVAIDRWLTIEAALLPAAEELELELHGTLAPLAALPADHNRLAQGFRAACRAAGLDGRRRRGVRLSACSEIPVGRGLGSSAASVVAGALAANRLHGLGLTAPQLAVAAAEVEGHADNVAAALFGGATLVVRPGAGLAVRPIPLHSSLALVFAVPDFEMPTRRARAVLPEFVPHRVAAAAAARSAALVHGLATGDGDLLALGLDDVLHVPFRRRLVRGYATVTAAARAAGAFGATLSGSGSSILAVAHGGHAAGVGAAMRAAWRQSGVDAAIHQPSIVKESVCR